MADISISLPPNYVLLFIDNSATGNQPLYLGYGLLGTLQSAAGLAIRELGYDGNGNVNSTALFASNNNGNPATNLIWNNRASYTYS